MQHTARGQTEAARWAFQGVESPLPLESSCGAAKEKPSPEESGGRISWNPRAAGHRTSPTLDRAKPAGSSARTEPGRRRWRGATQYVTAPCSVALASAGAPCGSLARGLDSGKLMCGQTPAPANPPPRPRRPGQRSWTPPPPLSTPSPTSRNTGGGSGGTGRLGLERGLAALTARPAPPLHSAFQLLTLIRGGLGPLGLSSSATFRTITSAVSRRVIPQTRPRRKRGSTLRRGWTACLAEPRRGPTTTPPPPTPAHTSAARPRGRGGYSRGIGMGCGGGGAALWSQEPPVHRLAQSRACQQCTIKIK